MEEIRESKKSRPKILVWVGRIIIGLGILFIPLGISGVIVEYFAESGNIFLKLYSIIDVILTGIGICGFGLAITHGKRWQLFFLLIIVFFGSLLIGLFSMVGKETNVGYYIWTIGISFSIFLMIVLYKYWEVLVDG